VISGCQGWIEVRIRHGLLTYWQETHWIRSRWYDSPAEWFAIFVDVRTIVRKQLGTLGLGMAAGVVSASVASLIQNAFRVDGSFIFFPLCASLFLLVLKFGPDGWR
jgi:hypothetical protein